jgi:hypothetical protein
MSKSKKDKNFKTISNPHKCPEKSSSFIFLLFDVRPLWHDIGLSQTLPEKVGLEGGGGGWRLDVLA